MLTRFNYSLVEFASYLFHFCIMDLTKFFFKCQKNAGKIKGKIIFPPLWVLIKKLDHNSGLHAKNQREISSNKVRRLLWPLGGGKCGKV